MQPKDILEDLESVSRAKEHLENSLNPKKPDSSSARFIYNSLYSAQLSRAMAEYGQAVSIPREQISRGFSLRGLFGGGV